VGWNLRGHRGFGGDLHRVGRYWTVDEFTVEDTFGNADGEVLFGRWATPAMSRRAAIGGALLHAHEIVLKEARTMARLAADRGDDGTNDLIVSEIIRTNELQVWFMAEHVVDVPLAHAM
jgi:hypothetical protein